MTVVGWIGGRQFKVGRYKNLDYRQKAWHLDFDYFSVFT